MSVASYRSMIHFGVMVAVPESWLGIEEGAVMKINDSASQEYLFATATEFLVRSFDALEEHPEVESTADLADFLQKTYGRLSAIFCYMGLPPEGYPLSLGDEAVNVVVVWNRPPASVHLDAFGGRYVEDKMMFNVDSVNHYLVKTNGWVSAGLYSKGYMEASPKASDKLCLPIVDGEYQRGDRGSPATELCYALNDGVIQARAEALLPLREHDGRYLEMVKDPLYTNEEIAAEADCFDMPDVLYGVDWPIGTQYDVRRVYYDRQGKLIEDPYGPFEQQAPGRTYGKEDGLDDELPF